MEATKRQRLASFYTSAPWIDWVLAAALFSVAFFLIGLGDSTPVQEVAAPVSALSGIFAATAVFACGALAQSQAVILRVARALFAGDMWRNWVSIIGALALAAALPVFALYADRAFPSVAQALVVLAIALDIVTMIRVLWWVRYIAHAQRDEDTASSRHQTRRPSWMDNENR
ncbi:MAG: hypothetical protein ACTH6A_06500 [Brachybacterium tyrofermentans]|uniref:hypothetical protein n=1 Tax=Brachybacterium tyrofermentans TaxID=47848 RepID=UPI003F929510